MRSSPVHNPTTDTIRARYMAAMANRPAIDEHDGRCALMLIDNAMAQLREACKLLRNRQDLAGTLKTAGMGCKAISYRLEREEGASREAAN